MKDKEERFYEKTWFLILFAIVFSAALIAGVIWLWFQIKNDLLPILENAASFFDIVMESGTYINVLVGLFLYVLYTTVIIILETLLLKIAGENFVWRFMLIAVRCLLYMLLTIFFLGISASIVSSFYQILQLNFQFISYTFILVFCLVIGLVWVEVKVCYEVSKLLKERSKLQWLVKRLTSREQLKKKFDYPGTFAILSVIVTLLVLADTASSLAFPAQPSDPVPTRFTIDTSTLEVLTPEGSKTCKEGKNLLNCQDYINYVLSVEKELGTGNILLSPKVEKESIPVTLTDELISNQIPVTNNTQDFSITGKYQETDHSKIEVTVSPANKGYFEAYWNSISFKFLIFFVTITLGYLKLLMEQARLNRKPPAKHSIDHENTMDKNQDTENTQDTTEQMPDDLILVTPVPSKTLINTYGNETPHIRSEDKLQEQGQMPSLQNNTSPAHVEAPIKNVDVRVWKALSLLSLVGVSYLMVKETKRNKDK